MSETQMTDFDEDFKLNHGTISTGENRHYCPEWDFMPIDDNCKEMECCTCQKKQ